MPGDARHAPRTLSFNPARRLRRLPTSTKELRKGWREEGTRPGVGGQLEGNDSWRSNSSRLDWGRELGGRGTTRPSHAHAAQSPPTEPGTKRRSPSSVSPPAKWAPDVARTPSPTPRIPPDHPEGCQDPRLLLIFENLLSVPRSPAASLGLRTAGRGEGHALRWGVHSLPVKPPPPPPAHTTRIATPPPPPASRCVACL